MNRRESKLCVDGTLTHDETREIIIRGGARRITQEQCELGNEIIAPILQWGGAEEEHPRSVAELSHGRVAPRAGVAKVMRLVHDDEIRIDNGLRTPTAESLH